MEGRSGALADTANKVLGGRQERHPVAFSFEQFIPAEGKFFFPLLCAVEQTTENMRETSDPAIIFSTIQTRLKTNASF